MTFSIRTDEGIGNTSEQRMLHTKPMKLQSMKVSKLGNCSSFFIIKLTKKQINRKWAQMWKQDSGVLCNKGYPPETHLKLKCREIAFAHNLFSVIQFP